MRGTTSRIQEEIGEGIVPAYIIKVETDVAMSTKALARLEDVVYDVIVDEFDGSTGLAWITNEEGKVECAGGVTDVYAVYN
jgi:hypothetical protein